MRNWWLLLTLVDGQARAMLTLPTPTKTLERGRSLAPGLSLVVAATALSMLVNKLSKGRISATAEEDKIDTEGVLNTSEA